MFFLVLSYGISTTLLQILSSLRFPIHQVKGVHWCSRKKLFEHSEASILAFQKNNCSENFSILCILSSETSRVEFFLSTLVGLPGITPKSFQSSYSADTGLSEQFRCPLFGTKNSIFQMSFETESSCIHFCLLYYSNFLAAKCKRYLHFSYMQFIDCLQIHGITQITYLNIQEASNK